MGQAKKRGTFDERVQQAQLRKEAQETLKLGVKNSVEQVCTNCGCPIFTRGFSIRRISFIYTPSGKDEYLALPQQITICASCAMPLEPTERKETMHEQKTSEKGDGIVEGRDSSSNGTDDDYRAVEITD